MRRKLIKIINAIGMILIFLSIGFLVGIVFGVRYSHSLTNSVTYAGLWTVDFCGYNGDWIHVNINDMSFQRALEVCRHEVFHEIWSECGESNNLDYCIEKYEEGIDKNATL